MAVAYVAYQHLNPATRDRVKVLLALNPYYKTWKGFIPAGTSEADTDVAIFIMAATWPDEIKLAGSGYTTDGADNGDTPPTDPAQATRNDGYTDKTMHKYWHFVDTPYVVGNAKNPGTPTPNVVTQINAFRTTIASSASDDVKSYDLVWLEHLVGDIHQPLHCATRISKVNPTNDHGGNLIKTKPTPELHAFWDNVLGKGETMNYLTAENVAMKLPAADSTLGDDTSVDDWSAESFKLATADAYKNPPIANGAGPYTLTPAYKAKALQDADQRVALAGYRLAKLLNDNLK
jgi:hypothetical protein